MSLQKRATSRYVHFRSHSIARLGVWAPWAVVYHTTFQCEAQSFWHNLKLVRQVLQSLLECLEEKVFAKMQYPEADIRDLLGKEGFHVRL